MNAADRAQVLSRSRVFAAVPRSDLAVLAEMMKVERFPAGSTVTEDWAPLGGAAVSMPGSVLSLMPSPRSAGPPRAAAR